MKKKLQNFGERNQKELNKWVDSPYSWIERLNSVKMPPWSIDLMQYKSKSQQVTWKTKCKLYMERYKTQSSQHDSEEQSSKTSQLQ